MELITSVIVSTLTIGFTSVSCFIYYYYKHLKKQENYIQNIFNNIVIEYVNVINEETRERSYNIV
jgi:hypothetical protein